MQDADQTNTRDLREKFFFKSRVCIQIITLTSLVDHAGEQEAQVHQAFVLELRIDAYSAEDAMEMSFSSKAGLLTHTGMYPRFIENRACQLPFCLSELQCPLSFDFF
jgi:hypothetical protein